MLNRAPSLINLVVIISFALVGCAPQASEGNGSGADTAASKNPYAAEFQSARNSAQSEFERAVLEDNEISDSEYAEVNSRFVACLKTHGIETVGYQADGSLQTHSPDGMDPDVTHSHVSDCESSTGSLTLSTLYRETRTNPEHADFINLIISCLIRKDIVPSGYTELDFERDQQKSPTEDGVFSFHAEHADQVSECQTDPQGLLN